MSASTAISALVAGMDEAVYCGRAAGKRRHINRKAGRALEVLGHAIDYLIDEHLEEGGSYSGNSDRLDAAHLLMAVNREIYFECPEIPSVGQRVLALLGVSQSA